MNREPATNVRCFGLLGGGEELRKNTSFLTVRCCGCFKIRCYFEYSQIDDNVHLPSIFTDFHTVARISQER